jgi:hypothetical protein
MFKQRQLAKPTVGSVKKYSMTQECKQTNTYPQNSPTHLLESVQDTHFGNLFGGGSFVVSHDEWILFFGNGKGKSRLSHYDSEGISCTSTVGSSNGRKQFGATAHTDDLAWKARG